MHPLGVHELDGRLLIPQGAQPPQGYKFKVDTQCRPASWFEIEVNKPRTAELTISQIVKKAEENPVRVWLDGRIQTLTAIQVPMPAFKIGGYPHRAEHFCLTMGSAGTKTFPIHTKIEVVIG